MTGFLLLHLLKHFAIFISASSCTVLNCQSFFPGLWINVKSIKQGGIVPKIMAEVSFPLLQGSVQLVSLPLAWRWYSLHTQHKSPQQLAELPVGSLDQIKQIRLFNKIPQVFDEVPHSATNPGKRRHLKALLGCIESTTLPPSNSLPWHIWL